MINWQKSGKIVLILTLIVITFGMSIGVLKYATLGGLYSHYVDSISSLTGINKYLVKVAVILMLFPFLYGLKLYFFSFKNKKRKLIGAAIVITILVLYNLGLYQFTKSSYFAFSKGEVLKWYANTPEGVRFFDSPGFDPKYGIELKAVTPEIIANIEKLKRGMEPKKLAYNSLEEIDIFDRITGKPQVWYYKYPDGNIEFYNKPGIHPFTGKKLNPINEQVYFEWKRKLQIEKEKDRHRLQDQKEQEEAQKEEQKRLKLEAERLKLEKQKAERRRQEQEEIQRKKQESINFEKLVLQNILDINWKAKPLWVSKVEGKKIIVNYTENTRLEAAKIVGRLRKLRAQTTFNLVSDQEIKGHSRNLYYFFNDLESATAIHAAIVDVFYVSLTSTDKSGEKIILWIG